MPITVPLWTVHRYEYGGTPPVTVAVVLLVVAEYTPLAEMYVGLALTLGKLGVGVGDGVGVGLGVGVGEGVGVGLGVGVGDGVGVGVGVGDGVGLGVGVTKSA